MNQKLKLRFVSSSIAVCLSFLLLNSGLFQNSKAEDSSVQLVGINSIEKIKGDIDQRLSLTWKAAMVYTYDLEKENDKGELKGTEILLTYKISEQNNVSWTGILKFRFDRKLYEDGEWLDQDFDISSMIKEVRLVRESDLTKIEIGKQEVAYGMDYNGFLNYRRNPMHGIVEKDQVLGVTLKMKKDLVQKLRLDGAVDTIEFSVFEHESGDLDFNEQQLAGSVRITKEILKTESSKLKVVGSAMVADNGTNVESRVTGGYVYQRGKWVHWTEVAGLNDVKGKEDASVAITSGLSYRISDKVALVSEFFMINGDEDKSQQWQAAFGTLFTKVVHGLQVNIEPSVFFGEKASEKELGVAVKTEIKPHKEKVKSLFGDAYTESIKVTFGSLGDNDPGVFQSEEYK